MAIQELYNKLRIKREYGQGDIVTRLTFNEVDTLLQALIEYGADPNEGYSTLLAFKQEMEERHIDIDDRIFLPAYENLVATALTGKFKGSAGFIRIIQDSKKPIKLTFPWGASQVYTTDQIEVADKHKGKFNDKIKEILSHKG